MARSLSPDFRQNLLEVGQLQCQVDQYRHKQNDSAHKLVRDTAPCKYNHESSDHTG